jgi:predicted adenylyl cyclase CyaB
MPFEIELKVRLDDFKPVKEQLSAAGTYLWSYKKSDSYWYPGQAGHFTLDGGKNTSLPLGVRVRREYNTIADGTAVESVLVTYKTKEITDSIEINDEREFTVSDAGLFEELLTRLGLYRDICKEKEGWAWSLRAGVQPSILAELSMVNDLGWFLELEIIADQDDEKTIEESRKRLLVMLEKLEIPTERIETRPYTAMLREKRKG